METLTDFSLVDKEGYKVFSPLVLSIHLHRHLKVSLSVCHSPQPPWHTTGLGHSLGVLWCP